jgi:hypothetical protein
MHFLALEPSWERKALNRTTFGCRDVDEAYVQQVGWAAWVEEQLDPPAGDDDELAQHIANQTLHIEYEESNEFTENDNAEGWDAVNEERPLNYLSLPEDELYQVLINAGNTHPWDEVWRVYVETMNGVYLRAAHSSYQLREVMTDFWLNHFSVWYDGDDIMRLSILIYDRDVIRPRVFGNFRDMLGAKAQSTAMMWYLDNAGSPADLPNENYSRELMELHTLGEDAYLGTVDPATVEKNADGVAVGFTDQDVIEVSRAMSGWTVEIGQWNGQNNGNNRLPYTWLFTYNAAQHNTQAGTFLGQPLSHLTADMAQGERVLDLLAAHPATATFVTTKLARRFFGETPPEAVLTRAYDAWMDNLDEPDQIRRVIEAILLDGTEIGDEAPARIRRPFEKMVAAWRAMGATLNASWAWTWVSHETKDAPFDWPGPDGRPDVNGYWLAGTQVMSGWNGTYNMSTWSGAVTGDLLTPMPEDAKDSAIAMTDYWVGKMIGYELASAEGYNELVDYTFHWSGPMAPLTWMQYAESDEQAQDQYQSAVRNTRGFAALISTADEFSWV